MLSTLHIEGFRGIDRLDLAFGQKTYIRGANGSGKTHILDALHILSGAQPLYGETILELGTIFDAQYQEGDLTKSYRLTRDAVRDTFFIQGSRQTKPKYLQSLPYRTVYISPFDMNLLYFAPSMRREYIDLILARSYAQFPKVKKDYETVMRQRNALLKSIREGLAKRDDLDFWDTQFAQAGDLYGAYRARYRDFIQSALRDFPDFFARYSPDFIYESSWIDAENQNEYIKNYLLQNRERDILTGHTHIGPHRDDWGFVISKDDFQSPIPVQNYLSRGEMKMILLGLKVLEAHFIRSILDLPVILLIDDIFAELDDKNSEIFLNSLMPYQMILTSQKALPNPEKHSDFICINLENT